jgi:hypothetical protein
MTLASNLITMREDWFDTSMFYERCMCAGENNYLICALDEKKRSLESEEASKSRNVAADPATDLSTFLNDLSNSKNDII